MKKVMPHATSDLPLFQAAAKRVREVGIVLDVGAGIRPQQLVKCKKLICAEPCREYVKVLYRGSYTVIQARAVEAVELVREVDTIVALDVIEHLERVEGIAFLSAAVAKARQQVVIFTPMGFMPQDDGDGPDAWGMNGAQWQRHRSGWMPEDFPGWEILTDSKFHARRGFGAFFAIHG